MSKKIKNVKMPELSATLPITKKRGIPRKVENLPITKKKGRPRKVEKVEEEPKQPKKIGRPTKKSKEEKMQEIKKRLKNREIDTLGFDETEIEHFNPLDNPYYGKEHINLDELPQPPSLKNFVSRTEIVGEDKKLNNKEFNKKLKEIQKHLISIENSSIKLHQVEKKVDSILGYVAKPNETGLIIGLIGSKLDAILDYVKPKEETDSVGQAQDAKTVEEKNKSKIGLHILFFIVGLIFGLLIIFSLA